jgi:hypothetical protein
MFRLNAVRYVKCEKNEMVGHVASTGGKWYRLGVMQKFEGQRPYRTPRGTKDYDIKMDLKERVWEGLDCIAVAQDRNNWWALANSVMKPEGL